MFSFAPGFRVPIHAKRSECSFQRKKDLVWFQLLLSALLPGSLAWAGLGLEGTPVDWHLGADLLHPCVAAFWPAELPRLRRSSDPARGRRVAALVHRSSALSLGGVALLAATGRVNGWCLVGSCSSLWRQAYGRWLLLNIVLFGIVLGIGAVNLFRLQPRLAWQAPEAAGADAVVERI
jgi:copper resistance protein D